MNLKKIALIVILLSLYITGSAEKPKILLFTKTAGFRHKSIEAGKAAIQRLASEHGFIADTTSNSAWFVNNKLKKYAAVVFLNTNGDVLNTQQEKAFENYIRKGGGYVGVHSASATEYNWNWYKQLMGAHFLDHPKPQNAKLHIVDKNHPSTMHLPAEWLHFDEWYNFRSLPKDVNVLILLDESSYKGGKNGSNHPIAWYHDFDGGRAFYTGLGHTEEIYSDALFLKHLLGGINYAIGK